MTRTEEFVYKLCKETFLSLWSFPNPIGKKGKELCDILIVCEPEIVIFSVKEINVQDSGNSETNTNRWIERAIDASIKQVYGAERFLKNTDKIVLKDKKTEIEISKNINWRIHRVAVAFGRGEKFPLKYGDFGKGFVHVFDENSVHIILKELDTIIGLATEKYNPKGYSIDFSYLHLPEFDDELKNKAKEFSNTLGFFNNSQQRTI